MTKFLVAGVLMAACGIALAKLPAPDDATKAKAAETAAKAAWQAKVDNFLLCKAQDKVAARYKSTAKPAAVAGAGPAAAAPAAAAPPTSPSAQPAVAGATPVAFAAPTPCSEPGPFAYTPQEQKPLEAAGAHSPAGTAASPPSGPATSAQIAPAKK